MLKIFKDNKLITGLNNSVYFEEIYCFVLMLISLALWKFAGPIWMSVIVAIAAITLFIFNDFKYMVPSVLSFMFSFNQGFEMKTFPWALAISGASFIIILIAYMIINGFHITKARSCIGLIGLTISCFIPIFWNREIIPDDSKGLYVMYLAYFFYLLVYILFVANLKRDSFRMTVIAFSYMAVLIACQVVLKSYLLKQAQPDSDPLEYWFYLGWGLCNEAGIMIISFIPSIFLLMVKSKTLTQVVLNIIKLSILPFGMLLTTSRGTLLFGTLEILILGITSLFFAKKKKTLAGLYFLIVFGAIGAIQYKFGLANCFNSIIDKIFNNINHDGSWMEKVVSALNPTGRTELWETSLNIWNSNNLTKILGSGIVNFFEVRINPAEKYESVFVVFHSTFFESIVSFGIVGMVFLGIHFFEKYLSLTNNDKSIMYIIGFGYAIIDIYGMLDNTYTMWYFMVPLMIMMASLDQFNGNRKNNCFDIY